MTATTLAAGFAVPALALAGLAATSIPVLIHLLLRRRRRPIEWAAMELLRKALERRRRQLRLERLLLLAVRMAALALLGAALARPHLGSVGGGAGNQTIWIVLDDGVSTRVEDASGGISFDRLVEATVQWVDRRANGDEIGVVLASGEARVLLEPTADRRRVAERLESSSPSLAATDLEAGLGLVANRLAASPAPDPIVLLASDLRRGSMERTGSASGVGLSALAAVEGLERLVLPPAVAPIDNLQITSIVPGRSPAGGDLAPLRVELARQGSLEATTTRISLSGPDLATAIEREVLWRRGDGTATVEILVPVPQLAPGEDPDLLVEVSLPPDAQAADDRRFALLDARPRLRVGVTADGRDLRDWFARALAPSAETPIELVPIEPALVDGPSLRNLEALVVTRPDLVPAPAWPEIDRMIERGGVVIVVPPTEGGGVAWLDRVAGIVPNASWSFGAGTIDLEEGPGRRIDPETPHPTWLGMIAAEFEELAEPVSISRRLEIGPEVPESEIVLRALDGAPLVVAATSPGGGSIALFAMALDLEWSDLPVRPLMVPLVQELLREGLVRSRTRSTGTVGEASPSGLAEASSIETPSGGRIVVRDGRLERRIDQTGRHEVLDAAGGRMGAFVTNISAAAASTEPVDRAEIASRFGDAGPWRFVDDLDPDTVAAGDPGDDVLSAWLLAGVIGLLVLEAVLSRRFSRMTGRGGAAADAPAFLAAYGVGDGGRRSSEASS